MPENLDNVIIEHLKALRNDVRSFREEVHHEFTDIKQRLNTVERGIAGVRHENADTFDNYVRQQVSLDRLVERMERVEKRLELTG